MSTNQQQTEKKQYEKYVKIMTPSHNLYVNMIRAFFTGGLICTLGQLILRTATGLGADKESAGIWCSLILICLSVLLTGLNIYPKIGKFGGARKPGPDHRLRQFRRRFRHRIPRGRTGFRHRMQDFQYSGTCDPLAGYSVPGSWGSFIIFSDIWRRLYE